MRAFIIMCLVAVACADKLGYNYQPVGHSQYGVPVAGGVIAPTSGISGENIDIRSPIHNGANNFDSGISQDAPSYTAAAPEFEKEFFSFSAPEAEFDDANAAQKIASSVKQGLRVIFIRGPEGKGLENAALALAKQAADQKTDIYVLNKQADIADLTKRINGLKSSSQNKPEVHFVKYRTPEDAANAQKAIQGQYDTLGGSSQAHNGGVAPVLNFASQGPVRTQTAQAPGASYLPASVLRRRL